MDAVKTSIHLISRHHFAGVTVRGDFLRISFLARAPLRNARIERTQVLGPTRVEHTVVIRTRSDVDAELVGWLRDAQQQQS
jgi:hypothetical protein